MALKKSIEINNSGINAEYLMIEYVDIVKDSPVIAVRLAVYKDKASRDSGKKPIERVEVKLDKNAALEQALIGTLYTSLKNLPELDGAEDV